MQFSHVTAPLQAWNTYCSWFSDFFGFALTDTWCCLENCWLLAGLFVCMDRPLISDLTAAALPLIEGSHRYTSICSDCKRSRDQNLTGLLIFAQFLFETVHWSMEGFIQNVSVFLSVCVYVCCVCVCVLAFKQISHSHYVPLQCAFTLSSNICWLQEPKCPSLQGVLVCAYVCACACGQLNALCFYHLCHL